MPLQRDASSDSLLNNGPRSEYVKRYQEYPIQKTTSYRPSNEVVRGQGKVESETVFRRDYPEHPLQKRERARPVDGNLRPEGHHDFTSSYQNEFPERTIEKRKAYKPDFEKSPLAAFDAQPSYRDDYREWELPKKSPKEIHQWQPPAQPFEGKTTIMNDYKEHQVSPRVDHRPNNKPIHSEEPFNASTDYKDTYKEHPLPQKFYREKEQWQKPTVPIDSTTIQQRDYKGVYAPKQKSLRPDMNPVKSDAPIESETTHTLAYKPHELPKRYRHEGEKYKRPDGYMDLNTTNSMQFTEHPLHKQEIHKPDSSHLLRGSGEMSKDTNYTKDYLEYPINRVSPLKPKNDYQAPTVPMESQTEYQADFYGRQPVPRENFKPKDGPFHSDQPFDDRTDYRDKFTEYKVNPRQQRPKDVYTKPTAPLDSRTTAQDSYQGPYQAKRDSFKPDTNIMKSDAPFDDSTTMNRDFKAHEVHRRDIPKQQQYQKPLGDMDLITSHNTHYKEHPLQKHTIEKPGSSHLLWGSGEMNSKSNYQGDYIERPIERRKNMKPENEYMPPTAPMNNETTHRADFFERELGPRENFKPREAPMKSDVPIDDRTGYRESYVPHKITPREMRPREVYKPSTVPLDDRTTVRESYQGPFQPKRESFKPETNLVQSGEPFQGASITNTDFKEHRLPDRYKHKAEAYHKPDGIMDLTTTNSTTFHEHALQKHTINRPESSGLLKGFGSMRKDTNYQGDFQHPPPVKREIVKAKNDYIPPSAPMDSTTTTQDTYTEHGIFPRMNYKPKNDYFRPDVPFDDRTDYRDKFTEHQISPRQLRAKETHKPPSAPLDSRTITNQSYIGVYQPKRESFRPDQNYHKPDIPIENDTTFGTSFKQWPLGERFQHKQQPYVKPDGTMDLTTVNRETYKEVHGQRPPMAKIGSSNALAMSGTFENNTSYSTEFVPKHMEQRRLVKPDNDYQPSKMPFEDKTEYRSSHVGYVAPREKSFRPNLLSDALGQRDPANPYHIQDDWRQMLNMANETTVRG